MIPNLGQFNCCFWKYSNRNIFSLFSLPFTSHLDQCHKINLSIPFRIRRHIRYLFQKTSPTFPNQIIDIPPINTHFPHYFVFSVFFWWCRNVRCVQHLMFDMWLISHDRVTYAIQNVWIAHKPGHIRRQNPNPPSLCILRYLSHCSRLRNLSYT